MCMVLILPQRPDIASVDDITGIVAPPVQYRNSPVEDMEVRTRATRPTNHQRRS